MFSALQRTPRWSLSNQLCIPCWRHLLASYRQSNSRRCVSDLAEDTSPLPRDDPVHKIIGLLGSLDKKNQKLLIEALGVSSGHAVKPSDTSEVHNINAASASKPTTGHNAPRSERKAKRSEVSIPPPEGHSDQVPSPAKSPSQPPHTTGSQTRNNKRKSPAQRRTQRRKERRKIQKALTSKQTATEDTAAEEVLQTSAAAPLLEQSTIEDTANGQVQETSAAAPATEGSDSSTIDATSAPSVSTDVEPTDTRVANIRHAPDGLFGKHKCTDPVPAISTPTTGFRIRKTQSSGSSGLSGLIHSRPQWLNVQDLTKAEEIEDLPSEPTVGPKIRNYLSTGPEGLHTLTLKVLSQSTESSGPNIRNYLSTGPEGLHTPTLKAPSQTNESSGPVNNEAAFDTALSTPETPSTTPISRAPKPKSSSGQQVDPTAISNSTSHIVMNASDLEIQPLDIEQPDVPPLFYGLDRVLFNPGVYQLQDPHSRVYNFDPYLQTIMPVHEFDFNALKQYKTSSQDEVLSGLARSHGKTFVGSTSSMTAVLAHFHYLLSQWRDINVAMLSRTINVQSKTFTRINRAPTAIFLRWQNGTYAIDADKEYDTPNVLMMLGKSLEKLLTLSKTDYERYRKSDPRVIPDEEREAPEAFQYTTMGDFLMRSQLDAYDSRLPGNGTFDLKTRAVVSIRMDSANFEPMLGYEVQTLHGDYESYEREYYDMLRSTMLKYMLQARMGRMDGIYVAYHNIERIFGFQYLPLLEIDRAIHGQVDPCLGDQEFKLSLNMLNDILNRATSKFPEQSLRFHFVTESNKQTSSAVLWVFAEPVAEDEIDRIQSSGREKTEKYEQVMMGISKETQSPKVAEEAALNKAPVPPGNKASSLANSDSDADATFLEHMEERRRQPLFAVAIMTSSSINGEKVDRPDDIRAGDKWTVDYTVQDISDTPEAWPLYAQARAHRKKVLETEEVDPVEASINGDTAHPKANDYYIQMLRKLASKGRDFRSAMNEAEKGREPVVLGQSRSTDPEKSDE